VAVKTRPGRLPEVFDGGFVKFIELERAEVPGFDRYPFAVPAVRGLHRLEFHPKVTYLIGENGSGKSTLVEAIAVKAGFNAEGGTKNFNFSTRQSHSELFSLLQLARGIKREQGGFFLRAESFFNVATNVDEIGVAQWYGGKSLHEQSHGESFMALAVHRFNKQGLYILDEPEAALSPARQLALLKIIHEHVCNKGSQFIIATHSPILMAYPDATIYELGADGIRTVEYEETEHFRITRDFLTDRALILHHLFAK
jgi:predicted ATPase